MQPFRLILMAFTATMAAQPIEPSPQFEIAGVHFSAKTTNPYAASK